MTRKLIIHIGSHKTGTSSIQHTLFKNKAVLQKQGYTLFCQDPDGLERKSGNSITWVKFKLKRGHRIEGKIRKKLPRALDVAGNNVIISAETLSWLFSEKEIGNFQKKLSVSFTDIKIIAYIRRQDMQAVSQYQEASKHSAFAASLFYDGGTRALPDHNKYLHKYLNYNQRLGMWADAFGDENTIIRVFESNRLKNGDAVDDFFDVTGLTKETVSVRKNESSGFEKTKVGHLISQREFPRPVWRTLTQELDNSGKMLPSRKMASSFYKEFKESNKSLNKRFSLNNEETVFTDNFEMYPVEASDLWTEDSANKAIQNLLKGVEGLSTFKQRDMEVLRQLAHKLGETDVSGSQKMLHILNKYGPESTITTRVKDSAMAQIKSYLRK